MKASPTGPILDLGAFDGRGVVARRVRAYVPRAPREAAPPERPVLVLLDGQNVFGDEGSYAGGWYAHVAADRVARMGKVKDPDGRRRPIMAPVILAIDHAGPRRVEELGAPGNARLDDLLAMIADRVLPAAHGRFRLGYGPSMHVLGGSSMGGLAAIYGHFRRPDVFGGALAMSPSLWFKGREVFGFVRSQTNPYRSRVYLDAGKREAGGRAAADVTSLANELRARGWSDRGDLRVRARVEAKGHHDEASWRRRFPGAIRFLFGP